MSLEKIISITGKPGLFKIISNIKNGLIVESVTEGKRIPVYASEKVSALSDISIYTYDSDMPLEEVFGKMKAKTGGKKAVDHKSKPEELRAFLEEVVEDFDQDRVYHSDLKKLFMWFNILVENNLLEEDKSAAKKAKAEKEEKPAKEKAAAKK